MRKTFIAACLAQLIACNLLAADQTYAVAGLEQTAEIIVDEWGVPHIYAQTHYDAFFVQGFNAEIGRAHV